MCAVCVSDVRNLFLVVYEMRGVLWVQCSGSFLSLRHLFGRRSLDIPMFASFCLFVIRALGLAEKGCSKISLLILLQQRHGHRNLDSLITAQRFPPDLEARL